MNENAEQLTDDNASTRAKFNLRIHKKQLEIWKLEAEISELQKKIHDAKTYIQALEDLKETK